MNKTATVTQAVAVAAALALLAVNANSPQPEPAPRAAVQVVSYPDCAEAAQWYYEHYVALVAESRELAAGNRTASPEWLNERIQPALAEEPGAYQALLNCKEQSK